MPFATTTSVLAPAGVVEGTVKSVDDAAPGAIETDVQLNVRAYVTTPVLMLVIRTNGKLVLSCTSSPYAAPCESPASCVPERLAVLPGVKEVALIDEIDGAHAGFGVPPAV